MSYLPISIKEAMDKINVRWYLPYVQRPYVWGSRYESERYICLLFDSLLRGYPIGGLILWETTSKIPFREFLTNYKAGESALLVDEGRTAQEDKALVYDGQQRLQTLYSCLKHTFNGRILCFDVTYDSNIDSYKHEDKGESETPFLFFDSEMNIPPQYIRMTEVFSRSYNAGWKFLEEVKKSIGCQEDVEKCQIISDNINTLWNVFLNPDKKALAYFPVVADNQAKVNEVFYRLNTGGIALTNTDILFSKLKEFDPKFEQDVLMASRSIYNATKYQYSPNDILQLLNYFVLSSTRIDADRIKSRERFQSYLNVFKEIRESLPLFFTDFLLKEFEINNARIIPRRLALLPIVYFHSRISTTLRSKYWEISAGCKLAMKQYFILSQTNDWNIDLIVKWCKEEIDKYFVMNDTGDVQVQDSVSSLLFPLKEIIRRIDESKRRSVLLFENVFAQNGWFSLKILTPKRRFVFDYDIAGRFNPEIDHIFPKHPDNRDFRDSEEYSSQVNSIWNMQPVSGEINRQKNNAEPQAFFRNRLEILEHYDHLPSMNPEDSIWTMSNYSQFIIERKNIMKTELQKLYGLEFSP